MPGLVFQPFRNKSDIEANPVSYARIKLKDEKFLKHFLLDVLYPKFFKFSQIKDKNFADYYHNILREIFIKFYKIIDQILKIYFIIFSIQMMENFTNFKIVFI